MTKQELDKIVSQLKSEGHSMDDILAGFYKLYDDDDLSISELEGIVNLLGYHLSDEFKKAPKDVEEAKDIEEEIDKNADKEADKDADKEDEKETDKNADKEDKKSDKDVDKEDDDEDEEKRAMKLFEN